MGFMKTEQEQIEQIEKVLKYAVADYKHLKKKGVCYCYAETLIDHGYGDVSEYKAEIERLKAENEKYLDSIESVQAGRCRLRCPLTEQAVKEFAERLSVRALCLAPIETYHICNLIDELIKEVQNAEDKG